MRRSRGGKFSPLPAVFSEDPRLSPEDERYGASRVFTAKRKDVAKGVPATSPTTTPAASTVAKEGATAPAAPATPPAATIAPAATGNAIQQVSATTESPALKEGKKPIEPPALFPGDPDSPRLLTPAAP
jgi:hypothetical protein